MLSEITSPRFPIRHNANDVPPLLGQIQSACKGTAWPAFMRPPQPPHRRLAQNRWIRSQACCSDEVAVAYEMRNAGPTPKGVPCTTATPSDSKSSVTKSSSVLIRFPDG